MAVAKVEASHLSTLADGVLNSGDRACVYYSIYNWVLSLSRSCRRTVRKICLSRSCGSEVLVFSVDPSNKALQDKPLRTLVCY